MNPPTQPQQTREQFIESTFLLESKKDNYLSEKDAQKKLVAGITKGVEAISPSYGSNGTNSIVQVELRPGHMVTNDGKTILDSIKLSDKYEAIGLNILNEITAKSDKEAGDGRKTSVILAGAILKEGLKAKGSAMEIKRSLDECLSLILESIDKQTKQITEKEVGQVATLSSENPMLGKMYQEIYSIIGKEGILEIDNSNLPETSYEITEGVKLRGCGFTWPYMINDERSQTATYLQPYVLISKQKIQNITQLDSVFKYIHGQGRNELVIFCEDIDLSVSQAIAIVHRGIEKNGMPFTFKTLVIKAPTLWKDWLFDDFSKITGATIIDPTQGITFKRFQPAYLGMCDKIITTKDETVVLGIRNIATHLEVLKAIGDDDSKLRLAWLQTKTAILKLGANSETELSYLRGKATDARNASYLALNFGVVPGGGQALLNASDKMPNTIGGKIMEKALCAPYLQICENMGVDSGTKFGKEIIDPANVTKAAITNALSVVSTLLTTKLVITK